MSNKGIYTALSGAIAQSQRLDTIANNIANTNTTSFKKDSQTFREYLTSYEKTPDVINVPKIPASIESFYDMQGGDRSYVDSSGTYTDFTQGPLKKTGNNFDFAIEGQGFFEVLTPNGVRMSRHGSFHVDNEGKLVDHSGYPVLREGPPEEDPAGRIIEVRSPNVTVTFSGELYEGAQPIAKLSTVSVDNKDALEKVGASLYKLKNNYKVAVQPARVRIHQGHLEGSNVNIIKEMTDMISATRTFESTQKALKAFDEMNARLVNDIPRLR